jgi:cell division transport system ATP-binding protein
MINLEKVSKKFGTGTFGISDVSFTVEKGDFVFLVGPTGSGKTTIFRLLIREYIPSSGNIVVDGWDVVKLPHQKIPDLRKKIGVVFQDLKLLQDRTILENILLPLEVVGIKDKEALKRAEEILAQVSLSDHKNKFPVQLSGGELQRAAIARALILSPEILLADEPTGNLDDATSWEIVKLLSDINEKGTTIIMATHNTEILKKLNKRTIVLSGGEIVSDSEKGKEKKVKDDKDDKEEKKEKEEEKEKNEKEEKEEVRDDLVEALKDPEEEKKK